MTSFPGNIGPNINKGINKAAQQYDINEMRKRAQEQALLNEIKSAAIAILGPGANLMTPEELLKWGQGLGIGQKPPSKP